MKSSRLFGCKSLNFTRRTILVSSTHQLDVDKILRVIYILLQLQSNKQKSSTTSGLPLTIPAFEWKYHAKRSIWQWNSHRLECKVTNTYWSKLVESAINNNKVCFEQHLKLLHSILVILRAGMALTRPRKTMHFIQRLLLKLACARGRTDGWHRSWHWSSCSHVIVIEICHFVQRSECDLLFLLSKI